MREITVRGWTLRWWRRSLCQPYARFPYTRTLVFGGLFWGAMLFLPRREGAPHVHD